MDIVFEGAVRGETATSELPVGAVRLVASNSEGRSLPRMIRTLTILDAMRVHRVDIISQSDAMSCV